MITKEQEKAINSLKRAIAKCEKADVGIMAEDDTIMVCNKDDFREFDESPWDFIREKQYEYNMITNVKSGGCFLGSGGA